VQARPGYFARTRLAEAVQQAPADRLVLARFYWQKFDFSKARFGGFSFFRSSRFFLRVGHGQEPGAGIGALHGVCPRAASAATLTRVSNADATHAKRANRRNRAPHALARKSKNDVDIYKYIYISGRAWALVGLANVSVKTCLGGVRGRISAPWGTADGLRFEGARARNREFKNARIQIPMVSIDSFSKLAIVA
jgi:hypothetical protein